MSAWSPLKQPAFRAIWIATLVSNIGTWMQNTGAAWLMTSLAPSSAIMVALVQTATNLPVFLLALPAGALADVVDRRRLLLFTQTWMLLCASVLGALTMTGYTTPWILLSLTLSLGLGGALNAPAWQAIIPELVPRHELPNAVALNSAGFNLARAVGPALGGLVVSALGTGPTFILNAVSFLGVLVVLFHWRRPVRESTLPAERMIAAIRTGVRYVRHAPALLVVFIRAGTFIICGCSITALLPLVARHQLMLEATGYGLLLGFFGAGAVTGAFVLPLVRQRISVDAMVALGTLLFSLSLVIMALVHQFAIVCGSLLISGAAWLTLLSSFTSNVQSLVPSWVRGRAMSVYMLIIFGGMAGGSPLWGAAAGLYGISNALLAAALGLVLGLAATARYRLSNFEDLDLSPSLHWPAPSLALPPRPEDGPVLVTVEYRIDPAQESNFAYSMRKLRNTRLRCGAIRWSLFVDAADPERYIESFIVESWMEHLRQHERVTMADKDIERAVHAFHKGNAPPRVTHFLTKGLPKGPKRKHV
jgi:MFS family permease